MKFKLKLGGAANADGGGAVTPGADGPSPLPTPLGALTPSVPASAMGETRKRKDFEEALASEPPAKRPATAPDGAGPAGNQPSRLKINLGAKLGAARAAAATPGTGLSASAAPNGRPAAPHSAPPSVKPEGAPGSVPLPPLPPGFKARADGPPPSAKRPAAAKPEPAPLTGLASAFRTSGGDAAVGFVAPLPSAGPAIKKIKLKVCMGGACACA
jgi:hypothetical protein